MKLTAVTPGRCAGSERGDDAAVETAGKADGELAALELAREPREGPIENRAGLRLKIGNAQLGVSGDIGQLLAGELAHAVARDLEHMARRARGDRRQRNAPLPDSHDAVADNEMAFAVEAEEKLVAADGVAGEMDRICRAEARTHTVRAASGRCSGLGPGPRSSDAGA